MRLRLTFFVIFGLATSLLLGCDTSPTTPPAVASVHVNPASLSLVVGADSLLTATAADPNGNPVTGRSVSWQTDSGTAATVSAFGLVTAVAEGTARIRATVEGKSGTATVTVLPVPVSSVEVTPAVDTVGVGATVQLTATPKDSAGNALTGRTVTWTTGAAAVATVSGSGLVTAVAVGSAAITATVEGKSGTAAITVVGAPIVLHYDGTGWRTALEAVNSVSLASIWGATATAVFAVGSSSGEGVVLRYDGSGWSQPQTSCGNHLLGSSASGVWGSSSSDVFIGCGFPVTPPYYGYSILHYDGQQWSQAFQGGCSFCVGPIAGWSNSSTDAFAVGGGGMIVHYDGTSWSTQSSGTTVEVDAVWGAGPAGAVFAVGDGGTILHYDGSTWTAQASGTTQTLYAVWGTSANDVFAVGGAGTVLHYDGTTWTAQNSGSTQPLYGVWGTSGNAVFAVGDFSTIIHYDGTRWTPQTTKASMTLRGVWGSSSANVFAVGAPR